MNFEKDYFVNSKISNYKDYRAKKFESLAQDLLEYLAPKVIDFGCATGGLIYVLKKLGVDCEGTDISHWAIEYGKEFYGLEKELKYYTRDILTTAKGLTVLFLDTLEHMPIYEIEFLLSILKKVKPKNVIVRIPVSEKEGEDFVLEVSRNDKTHINVHSKKWWEKLFKKHGFIWKSSLRGKTIYDSEGVMAGVFVI
jgi:2-polyprenyl-3-methyl-5-hydroxy-6-metoxy-1,4-benzoquinol methylase